MTVTKKYYFLILSCLFTLALFILNKNNSFFWDGVHYGSIEPDFYYCSHFKSIIMPNSIDSGEVPIFALYIASIWSLFGRTIEISHFAMLPFVIGILYQLYILCLRFFKNEYTNIVMLLLLADTTLLSQFTLVSPDLPLLFFFLLGLNSLFDNRKVVFAISVFFLFINITRGIMLSFCLLLLDINLIISQIKKGKNVLIELIKRSLIYLPGFLVFLLFSYHHYIQKGWILSHQDSPWKDTKVIVDGYGLLFNMALLCWRLIDFGKIMIWIVLLFLLIKLKKQFLIRKESKSLLFLLICLLIFVHIDLIWANNLLAHRYFMPFNIILTLLCATILFSDLVSNKLKHTATFLMFISLISGSFWIYPNKIAKGWDATLSHLPYYDLRHQAIEYLVKKQINFKEVDSFFPNVASLNQIDLNGDQRNFDNYDGKSNYVFYSNIYNITDKEYDEIHNLKYYKSIQHFENKGVFITIYKKIKP
jgi:hypothetical protein